MARLEPIIVKLDGSQVPIEARNIENAVTQMTVKSARQAQETARIAQAAATSASNSITRTYEQAARIRDERGRFAASSEAKAAEQSAQQQGQAAQRAAEAVKQAEREKAEAQKKTLQLLHQYDAELDKLVGNTSEIHQLNKTLADPAVANHIDDNTKALLRQKAAMIDNARAAREATEKQKQAQSELKQQFSAQNIGSGMQRAGQVGTAILTLPILMLGGLAIKAAKDYDDAMDDIRVGTGATGEALRGLEQDFRAVFSNVPSSSADVARAIADLNTRLDTSGKPLQNLATQVLNLSRLTKTDLSSNIAAATRVFGDWGIATDKQSDALDYLYKVSQKTGIPVDRLGQLVVQYGAPLRQMGFSFEQAAAMVGKFEKEGVNLELVMGSLRIALGRMAKDGVTDTVGALSDIIKQIKEAGSVGQANAIALEHFGARAGPDMAAAIREGRLDLDGLLKQLKESKETINSAAADADTDAWARLGVMWNRLSLALQPLGANLVDLFAQSEPYLMGAIALVTQLVDRFSNLPSGVQAAIGIFLSLVAAIGPVLIIVGGIVIALGGFISTIITAAAAVGGIAALLTIFGALLVGIPVYLATVGAGLTALATVVYALYQAWQQNMGGIRDLALEIWGAIQSAFSAGLQFIQGLWAQYGGQIMAAAQALWNGVLAVVTTVVSAVVSFIREQFGIVVSWVVENWPLIKQTIETVLAAVVAIVRTQLAIIQGFWQVHGQTIMAIIGAAWTVIKTIVSSAIQIILAQIKFIMAIANGDWAAAWEAMKTIVSVAFRAVVTILGSIGSVLVAALKSQFSIMLTIGKWLWDKVYSLGESIVDGLVAGIKAAPGKIIDAIKGIASTAFEAGKIALKINSPSLVFMELGHGVVEGFVKGIDEKQQDAAKSVQRLVIPENFGVSGKGKKQTGQNDKDGWQLLQQLYQATDKLGLTTKRQEVEVELLQEKYQKLSPVVRQGILDAADEYEARQKLIDAQQRGRDLLTQASEQAADAMFDLRAGADGIITEVEKFDYALSKIPENARPAASAIKVVRDELEQLDKARAAQKAKAQIDDSLNSLKQMADEASVALRDFGKGEQTGLDKLLDKVAKLKGIGVQLSDLNPIKDIAQSVRDLPEATRLTAIANAIDRIFGSLKTTMSPEDWDKFRLGLLNAINYTTQLDQAMANAKAAKQYGDLMSELNGKLVDNNGLTEEARVQKLLETDAYKQLDAAMKESLVTRAREVDIAKQQKEEAQKLYDQLKQFSDRLVDVVGTALDSLLKGNIKGFIKGLAQGFKELFAQIVKDYILSGVGGIILNMLGIGSGAGQKGGGGSFGSIFTSILSGLFGGGRSRSSGASSILNGSHAHGSSSFASVIAGLSLAHGSGGITPPTSLSEIADNHAGVQQILQEAGLSAAPALTGSGFSWGSLGAGLGAMAPFLGLGLGASLGSGSPLGSILGGIGGLVGGLGVAAGFGSFAAGSMLNLIPGLGSLSSLLTGALGPILGLALPVALVAAPLLIGAWLLSRNAQRRRNETDRAQLNSDTYQAIIQILNNARTGKYASLADARADFDKVKSDYFARISKYDSKTRDIAARVWNNEFEPIYWPLITQAFQQSEEAKVRDTQLVPEFNTGGATWKRFADGGTYHPQLVSQLLPMRPDGLTAGVYSRADQYVARFTGNEVILNPQQWMPIAPLLSVLSVPGFADGGAQPEVSIPSFTPLSGSKSDRRPIIIKQYLSFDGKQFVLDTMESDEGEDVVLEIMGSYEGRKVTANNNRANQEKRSF